MGKPGPGCTRWIKMTILFTYMKPFALITCSILGIAIGFSQVSPVRIVTEDQDSRVMVYAVNESETDYDVLVNISGSNFRQSRAVPRYVRVPAASRVFIKALIPIRDKVPDFKFAIELNDSLSNRSIIREYENQYMKKDLIDDGFRAWCV